MEHSQPTVPQPSAPGFLARHQFVIYRLFSLAGLVPIGGYLCIHLLVNATVLDSPATFQAQVDRIHSLGIILPLVEWTFIFLPILFHAAVGWLIISGAVPNSSAYPLAGNIRYTLQRVTGIIAFFFIIAHVLHMHHLGSSLAAFGGGQFEPERAASSAGKALQAAVWVQIAYAVGVLSIAFHFGNGLWTQGITWGIWTTPAAQRRAGYVTSAIGVLVAVTGLAGLTGMTRLDVDKARAVEERMERVRRASEGQEIAGDRDETDTAAAAPADAVR